MARGVVCALCTVLLLLPGSVLGGSPATVSTGTRVRLTAPEVSAAPLIGTLSALDSGAVRLSLEGRSEPLEVPRSLVTRWEVSRGWRSNTRRGAGRGLLAGAAVGAGLGALAYGSADAWTSRGQAMLVGGAFFGGIGAGLGALVGALHKTERWVETEPEALRLAVSPVPGGVGLSLQWSFGGRK